jgi:hypothetical protein
MTGQATTPPTDAQVGVRSYRRRPVEVEAVQVTGWNGREIAAWIRSHPGQAIGVDVSPAYGSVIWHDNPDQPHATNFEAEPGDWIVHAGGRFTRVDGEMFDTLYEPAAPEPDDVGGKAHRREAVTRG